MLYNIIMSSENEGFRSSKWSTVTTSKMSNDDNREFYNYYFENPAIHQKIRIGDNHKSTSINEIDKKETDSFVATSYSVDTPSEVKFINNNLTLNLSMVNKIGNAKKKADNGNDVYLTDIAYIIIDNKDYKLASYGISNENAYIIQSFKINGEYQGCAIGIADGCLTGELCQLTVKNLKTGKPGLIKIEISDDKTLNVTETYQFETSKEYSVVKKVCDIKENKFIHFKVKFPAGYIPTKLFIVDTSDEGVIDKVKEIIDNKVNSTMICCPIGDKIFDDEYVNHIEPYKEQFNEEILKKHIRALTTVNMTLPKWFCKTYKIYYLFSLDLETGEITCVKTN